MGYKGVGVRGENEVWYLMRPAIAAFRERLSGMISSVCAEEFVAKPSFMGCQRCDYRDLCEVGEKGAE